MARLLGKPEGEAGRAVAERLNRVNADITAAVYQRLQLKPGERVLEIGFGNGRLLPELLSHADDLSYVGLDIAETMVVEAITFNAELVASGQASFQRSTAEAIPYSDGCFDKVFAVNVIYFWPDPVRALSEMRRVLRPGGMSVIAAVKPETDQPPPPFAREEYGFRAATPQPWSPCIAMRVLAISSSTTTRKSPRVPTERRGSGAIRSSSRGRESCRMGGAQRYPSI